MRCISLKFFGLIAVSIFAVTTVFSQTTSLTVASPKFSHLSGRYTSDIQVQLTTTNPNGIIFFTLDGSKPNSSSQQYTVSIPISGDGSYKTLKAITISGDTQSVITSATYLIDNSYNPNAAYRKDLNWDQYTSFMIGDWFGYASTPWTDNYCVELSILDNENYIDSATSSWGTVDKNDVFGPVFYYGKTAPSPLKKIAPYDILASGYANGTVDIDFGFGSVNQDELRLIKFIDENNLYLEMWHHSQYGPLKYYLTKKNSNGSTGIKKHLVTNTLAYPNPASDKLFIKNLNSDVKLIDQLGNSVVLEKSEIISVSHLPKGLYFLMFTDTEGTEIKQKLLIE